MRTQNVAVYAASGTGTVKERSSFTVTVKSSGSEFDMLLGNCVSLRNNIKTGSAKAQDDKDTKFAEDISKTGLTSSYKNPAVSSDIKTAKEKTADTVEDKAEDNRTQEDMESDDRAVSAGQIIVMFDQIRSAITDTLGITGEELNQMMEELGLGTADLLNPQAIKQLVLYSSGTDDTTVLLLDEQINETFRSLTNTVDSIIKANTETRLTDINIEQLINSSGMNPGDKNGLKDDTMLKTDQKDISVNEDKFNDNDGRAAAAEIGIAADEHKEDVSINAGSTPDTGGNEAKTDRKDSFDPADGFEAFLNRLDSGYGKTVTDVSGNTVKVYNIKEIARQIIEEVRIMAKPGQTTMVLQLYPEHLGRVSLTLSSGEQGTISAHFVVQNEQAREMMEAQMAALKDSLAQQNIKVENIEVAVAAYSFGQDSRSDGQERDGMQQKNTCTGRRITLDEALTMGDEPAKEDETLPVTDVSGQNIDYTA